MSTEAKYTQRSIAHLTCDRTKYKGTRIQKYKVWITLRVPVWIKFRIKDQIRITK
jgi:hypothetical protein